MTTLTVYPTKDLTIVEANPDTNYSSPGNNIIIKYNPPNDDNHGLISFDLSEIPAGAIFSSVKLRLYCNSESDATDLSFNVYRLLLSWTENGATWNSRDGSNNWNTAGAQGADTDRSSTVLGEGTVTGTGWIEVTFSSLTEFKNMVNNNNGLVLIPQSGGSNGTKAFDSKDKVGGNDAELVIEYTLGGAQAVWFT